MADNGDDGTSWSLLVLLGVLLRRLGFRRRWFCRRKHVKIATDVHFSCLKALY